MTIVTPLRANNASMTILLLGTDHNVTTYGVVHYNDEKFLDQIKRLAELFRIGMLVNCFEGTGLVGVKVDRNSLRSPIFPTQVVTFSASAPR